MKDGATGGEIARTLQGRFQIPCVFVSADIEQATTNRDAAFGLIAKPASAEALLAALAAIDKRRRGEPPDETTPGLDWFE